MHDPQFTAMLNRAAGPGNRTKRRKQWRQGSADARRERRPTLRQRRQALRDAGAEWLAKRQEAKRAAILGRLMIGQY